MRPLVEREGTLVFIESDVDEADPLKPAVGPPGVSPASNCSAM
jgi:hypothetical protein